MVGFALAHHRYFSYRDFRGEIMLGEAAKNSTARQVRGHEPLFF